MRHKIEIHQTEEKRRRQFPKTPILRQLGLDLVFQWALQEPSNASSKARNPLGIPLKFLRKLFGWTLFKSGKSMRADIKSHQNELENCKEYLGELLWLDLDNRWQAWRIITTSKGPLGTLVLQVFGLRDFLHKKY